MDLDKEEKLAVTDYHLPGQFFGQLLKSSREGLDPVFAEFENAYCLNPNTHLLYADAKTHLWHYCVIEYTLNEEDVQKYFFGFGSSGNLSMILLSNLSIPATGKLFRSVRFFLSLTA